MVKITEVNLQSAYTWGNLAMLKGWNTVRLTNADWNSVKMTTHTGMQMYIEVTVIENTWGLLNEYYADWQSVAEQPDWAALKII